MALSSAFGTKHHRLGDLPQFDPKASAASCAVRAEAVSQRGGSGCASACKAAVTRAKPSELGTASGTGLGTTLGDAFHRVLVAASGGLVAVTPWSVPGSSGVKSGEATRTGSTSSRTLSTVYSSLPWPP